MSATQKRTERRNGLTRAERSGVVVAVVLVAVAAITRYSGGVSEVLAFVLAGLALASLAWLVSMATEQVGEHTSTAVAGTLQSTVGNLPEFFVVFFALQAGHTVIAETAILGSILVNALFVLGMVLIAGALVAPDGVMRFNKRLPVDASTLLMVAAFTIALLGIANYSHDPAGKHAQTISTIGAVAMLIVYVMWVVQYLRGDQSTGERGRPRIALPVAVGLLVVAGLGSAFVSDWFVHALEPTIHQLGISQQFAGLVIVAIAGNAVEHFVGIFLAYKGKADLAISVVKSSVAQIAAFMYPLLVLVSLATATHLTFALAPIYVAALVGTAILVWQITGDGEATPWEGAALIAVFVVLATVAWYGA